MSDSIPSTTLPHFAIIGAGLAGAHLAHRLSRYGIQVSVFEKSRGTGGRLSSCRIGTTSADLGAPYFDCRSTEFADWLSSQSNIDTWTPIAQDFAGQPLPQASYFVSHGRQSLLTRHLLAEARLITQTRVGYIWPELQAGQQKVLLRDEQGQALGAFDGVIITAPAQQAAPLLEAIPRFSKQAAEVEYKISWVAVLEIAPTTALKDIDLIMGEHPILARCIHDSEKPGRATDQSSVWLLEANSDWSVEHQDTDQDTVAQHLIAAFRQQLSVPVEIKSQRIHRWLYARHTAPKKPSNKHAGFLWDAQTCIGACGDWLTAEDAEGAWLSAEGLFTHLQSQLALSKSA